MAFDAILMDTGTPDSRRREGVHDSKPRELMDPFLRLLRYATPHRAVIAGASLAMVVYGAASAALAYLIKPIIDDVLTSRSDLAFVTVAILVVYLLKGIGAYFSSYLMEGLGHRVVMVVRNQLFSHTLDQSAAFFAHRTTGQLLSRINNDVGLVQRAVSETIGDLARESLVLLGCAVAAVLLRRQARAGVHDGHAAGRVSAGALRQEGADRDPLEPGSSRAHVACRDRSLHRSPHRQGVRRRAARSGQVRSRLVVAVPHQPEGHARAGAAAAVDGVPRRRRDCRRAVVRQPRNCQRAA